MSGNVFDLSVNGDMGATPPVEESYEPPTYLPSSVPNQPAAAAPEKPAPEKLIAERDVPQPPAPPTPPPPPAAEFLPTSPPLTVEVPGPPPVTDAVSQALLNAPPPQLVPQSEPGSPAAQATPATPPPAPAAPAAASDSYRAVSEPVDLKPTFVDAPVPTSPVAEQ